MRDYRHLEAYQLTRGLLAGICCAAPAAGTFRRLRHAAVAAAASIADGSTSPSSEAFLGSLEEAQAALLEVAREIESCRRTGSLGQRAASILAQRQARAARALATLIEATRSGDATGLTPNPAAAYRCGSKITPPC